MHRLPGQIAAVMSGMALVFVLALALFALWTSEALDAAEEAATTRQIAAALQEELDAVSAMNLDYAKWDEFVQAVNQQDIPWIAGDLGSSAVSGEVFQIAILWGGAVRGDVGWSKGGAELGEGGVLPQDVLTRAEHLPEGVPANSHEARQFFLKLQDGIFAAAVSRVELVSDGPTGSQTSARPTPTLLLIARQVDPDRLARNAGALELKGFDLADEPGQGYSVLPLAGLDGVPAGYLVWEEPNLDERFLMAMLPAGAVVAILVAGLSGLGLVLVRRSANELVAAEQAASRASRTDVMTGLPNRAAFNEVLTAPARAGQRAILFLDLNGFKRINDSLGHDAGDAVLIAVAGRLARLAEPGCLFARIAGDEFVFVVTGPDAKARTEWLAGSITKALSDPVTVLGHSLRVRMAMGYAVQVDDAMTGEELVRQADLAMYEAKRSATPGLVAFSSVIEQASSDATLLEQGLRRALERGGEISVAYQPIVGRKGQLVRAEALARWTSAELGPVPPPRFIAVAEQAGLIIELGRHLFQLLCDDLEAQPDLQVSLNVSTLELMAPDYVPSLVAELTRRGIAPGRIEIELTESVVIDDSGLARERLAELHAAGFSTALDDFGTGYSSIGYLRQMSFDVLKIDRSFVSKIATSPQAITLVSHMIGLAHGLGLTVVCEGVETARDLELIQDLGCDLAQGYHLDRPMPIQALAERWLARERGRVA